MCFVCKKRDCWSTRYIKEEYDAAREGFKKYIHQYLADNDIDDNFNKDIVLTTTSGNFFYNNYSIKHFMTLNGPIPIKTVKNIVIFINNNAFAYGLTGSIEPGGTEPSTARRSNKVNIENLTVDCYFDDNG